MVDSSTSRPESSSSRSPAAAAESASNGVVIAGTSANSWKLGTFRNTKILVHWSIIFLFGFNCLVSMIYTEALRVLLFNSMFWGPILILSLLVHELGHVIATKKLGGYVEEIVIWPLGGLTVYAPSDRGVKGDLIVAIAGPLMQIPIMIIFASIYLPLMEPGMAPFRTYFVTKMDIEQSLGHLFLGLCRVSFWYNLFILAINLVPIPPFDGLRIWAACLRIVGVSTKKTAKILSYPGMLLSLSLFGYGAFLLLHNKYAGGLSEMFLGAFGFVSSNNLRSLAATDRLSLDPVFGRPWYNSDNSSGVEMSGASSTNNDSRPSLPVPMEAAESAEIL